MNSQIVAPSSTRQFHKLSGGILGILVSCIFCRELSRSSKRRYAGTTGEKIARGEGGEGDVRETRGARAAEKGAGNKLPCGHGVSCNLFARHGHSSTRLSYLP